MLYRFHIMVVGLCTILAVTLVACGPTSQPSSIRMAFVPSGETQTILTNAEKLVKMMEEKTGYKIEASVPTSYAAVVEAIGANKVDVAWLAPFSYVLAHDRYGAEVVLTVARFGSTTYRGQIIVRADSGIKTLADLKGKRFAYVDAASTSGHLYPKTMIKAAGYDPDRFFIQTIFAGGHDKVVIAVYRGQVDGGAVFDDARTLVVKTLPDIKDQVVVIGKTSPIPNDTVAVRKGLSNDVVTKLTQALVEISQTDEGKKVLKDLYGVEGLVPAKDSDYDSIRNVATSLDLDLAKQN